MAKAFSLNNSNFQSVRPIDARSKIFCLFFYSVCIFFVSTLFGLAAMSLLLVVLAIVDFFVEFSSNRKAFFGVVTSVLKVSIPLYFICAFSFLANSLRWTGSGLVFYDEGIYRGIFYAVRILLLGWSSLFVANTVSLLDFSAVFKWLFWPLRKLKFPVLELSLAISIALRFIPQVFAQFMAVKEAQWCRGAKMDYGSVLVRVRSYCGCFVPLIVRMMLEVDDLADALTVRCWGVVDVPPSEDLEAVSVPQIASVVFVCMLAVAIACLL